MKTNKILGLVAVVGAMSLASCDDFLNDNRFPLSQQTANSSFWNNAVNVQNQINYFYEDYSGYGNGSGSGTFYWSWLSDDQVGRTAINDWKFKSVPSTSSSWTAPYTEIRRANLVLEGVEGSSLKDSEKRDFTALARLHRGRSYYDLVRRYGDVPLVTKALDPTDEAELFGPRTNRNEVMDFVLADLDYAAENIATTSNKSTFSKDMAQAFKVEVCLYEAAYARYHQKDEARAKKYYEEVVKAGEAIASKYPINPQYLSLYQSYRTAGGGYNGIFNNSEIIFAKAYEEGVFMNSITDYSNASDGVAGITKDAFEAFVFKDGLPASKTSYNNTDCGVLEEGGTGVSIANLLEVRDGRLGMITYDHLLFPGMSWSFTNTGAMSSVSGYGVQKFNNPNVPSTVVNEINKNYLCAPLFWGARLYCGILEAKAELGTLTDVDLNTYMKPLWDRAGIEAPLSVAFLEGIQDPANNMNVSSLIWEIRRLRRCELMLDDDIRYWDLIRWHQLQLLDPANNPDVLLGANVSMVPEVTASVLDSYLNGNFGQGRAFKDAYYLYPIPTNQLQLNENLTQNPGW